MPVVAGTADMAATLLGSGVYQAGTSPDSTGTSTAHRGLGTPAAPPASTTCTWPTRPGRFYPA
ncbi:hypothetical protein M8494_25465 [Serratia ureilytica]